MNRTIVFGTWLMLGGALLAGPASGQNVRVTGIDSLRVRSNIQLQFNTTSVAPEPSSEWLVRRARVGLRGYAAGWIRGDVEADFGKGSAKLKDAYVRLSFDRKFRIRVGQFKVPFDALETTSSRSLLVVERDGTPRGAEGATPNGLVNDLGYSDRDIGVEWNGRFGRSSLTAGVFNGSGDNKSEADDGKKVTARLGFGLGGGWRVSGAWSGQRIDEPPDADDETWYSAGEVAVTGGRYGEPGAKALGQVMFGDNFDPDLGGGDEASFLAVQGVLAYHLATYDRPYLIGWEPSVRLGWTDPDTDVDDDEATLYSAGINVYHHKNVKTQIGVDALAPVEGDTETAFRIHTVLQF